MTADQLQPTLSERASPQFWRQVLLAWLALCLLSLLINAQAIARLDFPDPDDILRLLQVRDWLNGQSWFDVHQYRIDPPAGAAMHWSRLIDPPIAAVVLALRPLVGAPMAELAALTLIPLLTLGAAVLLVARFAHRLYGPRVGLFACLVLAVSVPVLQQLHPLRIDHHGWQIVMALIALNAAFARNQRKGGLVAGLALATWLAISLEGLPFAAAVMGLFALRWLRAPADGAWLRHGMAGLAGGSAAIWLVSRPLGELAAVHCDAMSGAHLAVFALGAGGCWAATTLRRAPAWLKVLSLALTAAAGLAVLAALAPQCARGDAFAELDPVVREVWYQRVLEGLPLWEHTPAEAVQALTLPLLGLLGIAAGWRGAARANRSLWTDYAILVLAAVMVATMVERAAAVAGAIAAPAAAALVRGWLDAAHAQVGRARQALAIVAITLCLAPALPVAGVTTLLRPQHSQLDRQVRENARCSMPDNLRGMNLLPPALILAPLDTGPALLYASHHRIVASGHHRVSTAMRDVIDAFEGSPEQASAIVARRGVAYVAYCPGLYEPLVYAESAPNGLMALLLRGEVPAWLEPVALPGLGGLKLYRVRPSTRN